MMRCIALGDVVVEPHVLERPALVVAQQVGRARIAVARLADARRR